jgi:hypothetical protein
MSFMLSYFSDIHPVGSLGVLKQKPNYKNSTGGNQHTLISKYNILLVTQARHIGVVPIA